MEFKHLCLVRFKEGVVVDDIIEELTKLAGELDTVKFFGWYAFAFHLFCSKKGIPSLLHGTLQNVCYIFTAPDKKNYVRF